MSAMYHLMNEHNYNNVSYMDAVSLCGVHTYNKLWHRVQFAHYDPTPAVCPECLTHPSLPLYLLEEMEL